MWVLRTILILLLIVLRLALLAMLWPVAALTRFVTFASPLVLFFLAVILLHTSDPVQRSFAWSLIATTTGFTLASAGLTALQRKLRQDPMQWFGRLGPTSGHSISYRAEGLGAEPGVSPGIRSYPHQLPHMRYRYR